MFCYSELLHPLACLNGFPRTGIKAVAIVVVPEPFGRSPEAYAWFYVFIKFFAYAVLSVMGKLSIVGIQALGRAKQAIFFSLFRKVVIVIPLTLLLPLIPSLGVNGVFLAEAISNFVGGGACYITMLFTVWRQMKKMEKEKNAKTA